MLPATPAHAQTTYEVQAGQDFFSQGVPGFSVRFYPTWIKVHDGDTIRFDFPPGLGPSGAYPQEYVGENATHIGDPLSLFDFDPDDGTDALKFNLDFFFDEGVDCGAVDNPCVWGPNSELVFPAFNEDDPSVHVLIDAPAGTTLWAAGGFSPDANANMKVMVVGDAEAASTQDELNTRANALRTKDYEDALALHNKMKAKRTWHTNANGKRVYDIFVGASGGPIEMFASYPRRIAIPKGSRVQFHFMSQIDVHTATFGGPAARDAFVNFLIPACDPDGDEGAGPDVDPTGFDPETEFPTCPEGTTLEADVHDLLPWAVGDGKVTSNRDYENSGLIFPSFPDGGSFDVNPSPMTERFPQASNKKGFKFICLVHGGFMGGRVRVK